MTARTTIEPTDVLEATRVFLRTLNAGATVTAEHVSDNPPAIPYGVMVEFDYLGQQVQRGAFGRTVASATLAAWARVLEALPGYSTTDDDVRRATLTTRREQHRAAIRREIGEVAALDRELRRLDRGGGANIESVE